jgi:GH15 family glucan-1,4-alpha-glucosidase
LGGPQHGRWLLAPAAKINRIERRYRGDSLILETEMETDEGRIRLIDFMPFSDSRWDVVRTVEALSGCVTMRMELIVRFDYGSIVPWVRQTDGALLVTAGPDALELAASISVEGENMKSVAEFRVSQGERQWFVINYRPSHFKPLPPIDAAAALTETEALWGRWCDRCTYRGRWRKEVMRSLITLKALTYEPTGGLVAAPTTSLPEHLGGVRNWDYRYCWLRDATFTLNALLLSGYHHEASAWREWLLRAVAGVPEDLQILYGITGARRLDEYELPWLPGYEGSVPVRIGNAASKQFQLDIYGELMDAVYLANKYGRPSSYEDWTHIRHLIDWIGENWQRPDAGIWEGRGEKKHFLHSRLMCWVAVDRAIRLAQKRSLPAPFPEWNGLRMAMHESIHAEFWREDLNSFVQYPGADTPDGSMLLMPLVRFISARDPRWLGTMALIKQELVEDALVFRRAPADRALDGLDGQEGSFLACSFWYVECLARAGELGEARLLFEKLLGYGSVLGLYAEELSPTGRHQGNYPQALTHLALISAASYLNRMLKSETQQAWS